MRVDWVHPSWRDLVIGSLVEDAAARRHFLARCGVDGAALALSHAGGVAGERERPLLREDADWDALGDGLYALCHEADEVEAVQLLGVLDAAGEDDEVLALARLVLDRLRWAGKAVGVDALMAWAALSSKLDPRPDPPAVAMTWLELEPDAAPATPQELERFADWLRLAAHLQRHDRELLEELGFPARNRAVLDEFAGQVPAFEPVLERELRIEALGRVAALAPGLAALALESALTLRGADAAPLESLDELEPPPPAPGFPVARVLRDL